MPAVQASQYVEMNVLDDFESFHSTSVGNYFSFFEILCFKFKLKLNLLHACPYPALKYEQISYIFSHLRAHHTFVPTTEKTRVQLRSTFVSILLLPMNILL